MHKLTNPYEVELLKMFKLACYLKLANFLETLAVYIVKFQLKFKSYIQKSLQRKTALVFLTFKIAKTL